MSVTPETWTVVAGRPETIGAPLNHPIVAASNFYRDTDRGYVRGDGTPTLSGFEKVMEGLEGGPTLAFSSGMAAAAAVLELVPIGGEVAIPSDCYYGVSMLVKQGAERGRWVLRVVEVGDPQGWITALGTSDLVWAEYPSNPMLELIDLAGIAAVKARKATLVVDSTIATPFGCRPLDLGADVVMHSATKYLGGHSDLLMGTLSFADRSVADRVRFVREHTGAIPGALETFLVLRGVRTLAIRFERMQENAAVVAARLAKHPQVTRVRYPGFSSVVSFEVGGGDAAADRVCASLSMIANVTSLGGVETTLERRSGLPDSDHVPAGLIRVSVGIENVEDIWADLLDALG